MSSERQSEESIPGWQVINRLGYKGRLYLAEETGNAGVVLLTYPQRPGLLGIAWWDGPCEPDMLKANIKWSRSPLTLLAWAAAHKTAQKFGMLLHLLTVDVITKSN
jgi:hypothetical protein